LLRQYGSPQIFADLRRPEGPIREPYYYKPRATASPGRNHAAIAGSPGRTVAYRRITVADQRRLTVRASPIRSSIGQSARTSRQSAAPSAASRRLSRAPRYSPSQRRIELCRDVDGPRFDQAQCNASTGLSAALGDRLRRIETSIEDLSSYDSSPTSTLRNSAGVSQVRTQNRFLPRAKSVTNVTNTRIFFDSRHSALSRLSSMRWPWCSNHACCASGSGTDQHNCPRVSRTGCTESATLHRRATRLCQPEYLAVADPSARLCQPECLAVADPSAQLCQPKCLAGLARNRIIVYVIRFVIRYYPISQTQSGADPSRRDPPGL